MSDERNSTTGGSGVRMEFVGQPTIFVSQKQAAAAALAFFLITPLGRLAAAGVLGAMWIAGLVGYWIGTSA